MVYKSKREKILLKSRKKYIKQHPELSANQILKHWSKIDNGIRRKDGLKLVRETRKIKKKRNVSKYIPLKYKKQKKIDIKKERLKTPEIEIPEFDEGTYKIAKLQTKSKQKYFIKFSNEESFDKQLKKLILSGYGKSIKDFKITISEPKTYTPFISEGDFDLSLLDF